MAATPITRPWHCTSLPLWARVGLYGADYHGRHLDPGELRRALGLPPGPSSVVAVSNAIARARAVGLLQPGSSARVLWSSTRGGGAR